MPGAPMAVAHASDPWLRAVSEPKVPRPLPRRLPQLESVVWSGPEVQPARPDQARTCAHWPLNCVARIQNSSYALRVVSERLAWAGSLPIAALSNQTGCIDVAASASDPLNEGVLLRVAALSAEIQTHKLALRTLADDLTKVSGWLARASGSSWDAAKAVRQKLGLAGVLGDDQRVIAKDWLAADMNALLGTLLRRAVAVLDRVDLSPAAIRVDVAGQRSYTLLVQLAAEMLERAAALATQSALFMEDFDKRWYLLRQQISTATSVNPHAATHQ